MSKPSFLLKSWSFIYVVVAADKRNNIFIKYIRYQHK